MPALATIDDLAAYLGQDPLSGAAADQADLVLELVSGAIRRYCRQTFDHVVGDVAVLVGNWGPSLVLPERPVLAVSAVEVDDVALVEDLDWAHDGQGTLWRGPSPDTGSDLRQGATGVWRHWGGPETKVTVTYDHGYSEIDSTLRSICLAATARVIGNPAGLYAEGLAPYQVTYGGPASRTANLTREEKAELREGGFRRSR